MTSVPLISTTDPPDAGAGDRLEGFSADELWVAATHPAPQVAVVQAVGDIDLGTAPRWARVLTETCAQLAEQARPQLACDLTGVTFLGASGLAVLAELADQTERAGIDLVLVVDTRPVRRALELTALDRVFRIECGLLDALGVHAGRDR